MGAVCLFASANDTLPQCLCDAAEATGAGIARLGHTLVYGGSSRGLMGAAARGAVAAGGRVVGVMPRHLVGRERIAADIAELHLVETLAERKQRMADLSELFLVLPGGVGTLDEALEMITWYDVGLSRKPTLFVDIDGFWRDFVTMMEGFRARGVLRPGVDGAWGVLPDVPAALDAVAARLAPRTALARCEGEGS
jgi:uncharacterized protein (TIGR00730 family)